MTNTYMHHAERQSTSPPPFEFKGANRNCFTAKALRTDATWEESTCA
eukprot:CAMPEP_0170505846 /NCGR_PEP_ID=MMETSP0208-20121228/52435_1 /TAXON_ID=197538 /ORGANISM="Strombidium inclinatum, Strain S3" /LENGTH=46 /DNA_ID= /DNA_START= /DNA_END= /DNA_ORIENTATION=